MECVVVGSRLFIGNLAWAVNSDDLWRAFGAFGHVIDAVVVMDYTNKKSKGFGFVEFKQERDAQGAAKALNGLALRGRPIRIAAAKPKRQKDAEAIA